MEKQRGFLVTGTIQQAQKLKVCPEVSSTDETFSIATSQENMTGVARNNNAHSDLEALPAHIGSINHILVGLELGTKLMYTIAIMKVGMATITEKANRKRRARCSLACM